MVINDIGSTAQRLQAAKHTLNKKLLATVSTAAREACAQRLRLPPYEELRAKDDGPNLDLVLDTAIYDYYPDESDMNAVARYAAEHHVIGDERLVLDAMMTAQFTLLQVGEPLAGFGAHAFDLLLDEPILLSEGRTLNAEAPGISVAMRLLKFDGFAMRSGALMFVDDVVATLFERAAADLPRRLPSMSARDRSSFATTLLALGRSKPKELADTLSRLAFENVSASAAEKDLVARVMLESRDRN